MTIEDVVILHTAVRIIVVLILFCWYQQMLEMSLYYITSSGNEFVDFINSRTDINMASKTFLEIYW